MELTDESIGIDLGVKELATVSTGKVYANINKTRRIRQLKKRLRRQQHKLSRRLESNIEKRGSLQRPVWSRPLRECRNIERQNAVIRLIHKKITDIRNNYLHQVTTEIVKTKPSRIVMEDLNVRGMMKNRHLSRAIAEQKFYEFKRQIRYKCERYGIAFWKPTDFIPVAKPAHTAGI